MKHCLVYMANTVAAEWSGDIMAGDLGSLSQSNRKSKPGAKRYGLWN